MAYFDRFDVCAAYYCYAVEWHGGQWSKEYAMHSVLHRIGYIPGTMDQRSATLSENAKEIFDRLVDSKGGAIRDRR